MGVGENAVLDPEFRVRGVERLRVVDGSAMPNLVSAHINACILMMAEKAADLLRRKPEKQSVGKHAAGRAGTNHKQS